MSGKSLNNLGDLLRASAALNASPEERKKIMSLLGFEALEAEAPVPQVGQLDTGRQSTGLAAQPKTSPPPELDQSAGSEGAAPSALGEANDAWVEPLPPKPLYAPRWFDEVKPLAIMSGEGAREPQPDPLFKPEWVRSLLTLLLSVADRDGPFDWDLAAEQLSVGDPLVRLPRLLRLRMADGMQVLIDMNKSMRPFAHDQYNLLSEIKRLMPPQSVSELYFRICPTRGVGHSSAWPRDHYHPPSSPTPVLLLTDLGVARTDFDVDHPRPGEWLTFAETVGRAGNPLTALVPYPQEQVPLALRRAMSVVMWDRPMTPGQMQWLQKDFSRRWR